MTETPAPSPSNPADTAVVAAPPLAPGAAPLCYVVDEEASIRHFLSLVLHGSGIDTMEFPDGAGLRQALESRLPDLVFHNISLESADAIESVVTLGKHGFRGAVQLMSARGAAVLDHVKNIGTQHKLVMLPVLKKPFETDAIVKIVQELKLGLPAAVVARIGLDEAAIARLVAAAEMHTAGVLLQMEEKKPYQPLPVTGLARTTRQGRE